MTRTIEWTNSKGSELVATIRIQTSESLYCDGDRTEVACCKWHETVEIDGALASCSIDRIPEQMATNGVRVTGQAGNNGIRAKQMDAIDAARDELRATPTWAAHEAKIACNLAEVAEYDAHQARMDRMMGGSY